jgi:hypothetical protein
MSIAFSDTTNKDGLIQKIEDALGFNDGDITNDSTLFAKFTGKINSTLDEIFSMALLTCGWNVDDFNHTHDPIIFTNLVSGQRDYHFTTDEEGSIILNIYKVMVKDSSGVFNEIIPVDQQSDAPTSIIDGKNQTGTPTTYDKTGNGIFLDLIPNYSSALGLKIFIDREPTYFTTSDTTKVAGIDSLCHDYLYLKPAYEWARDKGLQNAERLYRDLFKAEQKIERRYGTREKDVRPRLTIYQENNH